MHSHNDSLRGEDYHLPDLLRTWWGLSSDVLLMKEAMMEYPTYYEIDGELVTEEEYLLYHEYLMEAMERARDQEEDR